MSRSQDKKIRRAENAWRKARKEMALDHPYWWAFIDY